MDWYGDYPLGEQLNPTGPSSGVYRVMRGGSWFNEARGCRSASRFRDEPDRSYDYLGFRLVLSHGAPRKTAAECS